jgi:hypothetical protein
MRLEEFGRPGTGVGKRHRARIETTPESEASDA